MEKVGDFVMQIFLMCSREHTHIHTYAQTHAHARTHTHTRAHIYR